MLQHDIVFILETQLAPHHPPRLPESITAAFLAHVVSRPPEVGRKGGLLVLVKSSIARQVSVAALDAANGMVWLRLAGAGRGPALHIAGCYIPPEGSAVYDRPGVADPWTALQQHISRHAQPCDSVLLMGDFNARTAGLPESPDLAELEYALQAVPQLAEMLDQNLPPRRQTDNSSNAFGMQLLSLLAANGMCIFNGRVSGVDNHLWTSVNATWQQQEQQEQQ